MEQAGQHEMLNWMALMGAMETLDRQPVVHDYVETHVFMSEKCFVSYPAVSDCRTMRSIGMTRTTSGTFTSN